MQKELDEKMTMLEELRDKEAERTNQEKSSKRSYKPCVIKNSMRIEIDQIMIHANNFHM